MPVLLALAGFGPREAPGGPVEVPMASDVEGGADAVGCAGPLLKGDPASSVLSLLVDPVSEVQLGNHSHWWDGVE